MYHCRVFVAYSMFTAWFGKAHKPFSFVAAFDFSAPCLPHVQNSSEATPAGSLVCDTGERDQRHRCKVRDPWGG